MSGQSESAVNRVVSLTDDRERVVSLHNSASWKSQSKLRQNVKTSSSQPMARHRGDDTDAGSSKAQSSSGGQKTDFPEMATNDDAFHGLKNVLGSAEYEGRTSRTHRCQRANRYRACKSSGRTPCDGTVDTKGTRGRVCSAPGRWRSVWRRRRKTTRAVPRRRAVDAR